MCTITFVPLSDSFENFVLTSNRDEAVARKTHLPDVYVESGLKLLYPKDAVAGGTWIGLSEQKRVVCLMNGGFEKHLRKPPYPKSRGMVVKDLLVAEDFLHIFNESNFNQTEAFTAIVAEWEKGLELYRLVWDGERKHQEQLPLQNYIWTSSFLYSPEARRTRQQNFTDFCCGKHPGAQQMMKFHSSREGGEDKGLIIDKGSLKTCSITQVLRSADEVKMIYKDLLRKGNPVYETPVNF